MRLPASKRCDACNCDLALNFVRSTGASLALGDISADCFAGHKRARRAGARRTFAGTSARARHTGGITNDVASLTLPETTPPVRICMNSAVLHSRAASVASVGRACRSLTDFACGRHLGGRAGHHLSRPLRDGVAHQIAQQDPGASLCGAGETHCAGADGEDGTPLGCDRFGDCFSGAFVVGLLGAAGARLAPGLKGTRSQPSISSLVTEYDYVGGTIGIP